MQSNLVGASVLALAVLAAPLAGQQRNFDDVEITVVPVAEGLYMLQGAGGNMGLSIGADGSFLVDDQFAPLSEKIQAAITALTDESVRFVLNTHWHGDHTGGNENFGKAGALIVAHENVRKRMNPAEFREAMERSQQAPPDALPVVTFNDEVNFYWNGARIHVFHVERSHTDGDAIVHFTDANVVHMGDTFFRGRYPFVDVGSGGTVQGMIGSAEQVLEMADSGTKIMPGHGDLAGPEDLRAYRDMLVTVRDRVQKMIAEGMSEEAVVTANPTGELDAEWGENSERFVRAVYQNLVSATDSGQ